jgi:hypothetical protein
MTQPPGPPDDWNDDDHYPMHPGHTGWNSRSEGLRKLRRLVGVLFVVLASASAVVIAVRYPRG